MEAIMDEAVDLHREIRRTLLGLQSEAQLSCCLRRREGALPAEERFVRELCEVVCVAGWQAQRLGAQRLTVQVDCIETLVCVTLWHDLEGAASWGDGLNELSYAFGGELRHDERGALHLTVACRLDDPARALAA
jgi:hypothetical protein